MSMVAVLRMGSGIYTLRVLRPTALLASWFLTVWTCRVWGPLPTILLSSNVSGVRPRPVSIFLLFPFFSFPFLSLFFLFSLSHFVLMCSGSPSGWKGACQSGLLSKQRSKETQQGHEAALQPWTCWIILNLVPLCTVTPLSH